MSDGKMNYERQKARREMAGEMRNAAQIGRDRERDMTLIFAGSVATLAAAIIGSGRPAFHDNPEEDIAEMVRTLLDEAKRQATEGNPLPTSEDDQS